MKKVLAIVLTILIFPISSANADYVDAPFPGPVVTNPVAANKLAQMELSIKNTILKSCTASNGEIVLGVIPGVVVKDSKNRATRLPGTPVNKSFATNPANAETMSKFYLQTHSISRIYNPITGSKTNASSPCVNLMFQTGMSIDEWAKRMVNNKEWSARFHISKMKLLSTFKCPETLISSECYWLADNAANQ
jgi:hypothetical protein